jgi:hypothetical protein
VGLAATKIPVRRQSHWIGEIAVFNGHIDDQPFLGSSQHGYFVEDAMRTILAFRLRNIEEISVMGESQRGISRRRTETREPIDWITCSHSGVEREQQQAARWPWGQTAREEIVGCASCGDQGRDCKGEESSSEQVASFQQYMCTFPQAFRYKQTPIPQQAALNRKMPSASYTFRVSYKRP